MDIFPEESIAERADKINQGISLRIIMKNIRFVHITDRGAAPLDNPCFPGFYPFFAKELADCSILAKNRFFV